jgi:hypothetical protein
VGLAVIGELRVPTGDHTSFLGDRAMVFAPRVAFERPLGPLRLLGNLGYRFRYHGQFLNLYVGNEVTASAGAIFRLPDWNSFSDNEALGELHLATPTEAPFTFSQADSLKTPLELLVGFRTRFAKKLLGTFALGRGLGIQTGYGREALRVIGGLTYDLEFHDKDGDGIPDDEDKCPAVAEDKDSFEDSDGCPEDDNDKDGIPDAQDLCPNNPGPKEYDGCPDTDGDEIPDNVDKCPTEYGPAENEGCPYKDPPPRQHQLRHRQGDHPAEVVPAPG